MYVPMEAPVRPSVPTMDSRSPVSMPLDLAEEEDVEGGGMRVEAACTTAARRAGRAGTADRRPAGSRVEKAVVDSMAALLLVATVRCKAEVQQAREGVLVRCRLCKAGGP